jgi:hypothetical protein
MSTQVPDNYCGHCGEPLAPGATTCAGCNTPVGTPESDQFGTHLTLDSNSLSLNPHSTDSGNISSFNSRPTLSSKIIPAGAPSADNQPSPSQLPLVKIIIGQGITITLLLLLVIALITHFSLRITPNPSTNQTATPTPHTLYQADWSSGLNGWVGSADWKALDGHLTNTGTKNIHNLSMPTIQVPFDLSAIPDYTIEARIQVAQTVNAAGFGFFVRYDNNGHGYIVGAGSPKAGPTSVFEITLADSWHTPLQQIDFTPGTAWHNYRIEVRQNHIMVFIDGGVVMDVTDATYPSGAFVGLWDSNAQLSISSFVIENA